MRHIIFFVWVISIAFIVFGCLETALAQETQEPAKESGQTPWLSLRAVRRMKLDIQSVTNDIKNGINYLKEKAKEQIRKGEEGIKERARERLKEEARESKESFFKQIRWGIDKARQGIIKIKDFFVNLF